MENSSTPTSEPVPTVHTDTLARWKEGLIERFIQRAQLGYRSHDPLSLEGHAILKAVQEGFALPQSLEMPAASSFCFDNETFVQSIASALDEPVQGILRAMSSDCTRRESFYRALCPSYAKSLSFAAGPLLWFQLTYKVRCLITGPQDLIEHPDVYIAGWPPLETRRVHRHGLRWLDTSLWSPLPAASLESAPVRYFYLLSPGTIGHIPLPSRGEEAALERHGITGASHNIPARPSLYPLLPLSPDNIHLSIPEQSASDTSHSNRRGPRPPKYPETTEVDQESAMDEYVNKHYIRRPPGDHQTSGAALPFEPLKDALTNGTRVSHSLTASRAQVQPGDFERICHMDYDAISTIVALVALLELGGYFKIFEQRNSTLNPRSNYRLARLLAAGFQLRNITTETGGTLIGEWTHAALPGIVFQWYILHNDTNHSKKRDFLSIVKEGVLAKQAQGELQGLTWIGDLASPPVTKQSYCYAIKGEDLRKALQDKQELLNKKDMLFFFTVHNTKRSLTATNYLESWRILRAICTAFPPARFPAVQVDVAFSSGILTLGGEETLFLLPKSRDLTYKIRGHMPPASVEYFPYAFLYDSAGFRVNVQSFSFADPVTSHEVSCYQPFFKIANKEAQDTVFKSKHDSDIARRDSETTDRQAQGHTTNGRSPKEQLPALLAASAKTSRACKGNAETFLREWISAFGDYTRCVQKVLRNAQGFYQSRNEVRFESSTNLRTAITAASQLVAATRPTLRKGTPFWIVRGRDVCDLLFATLSTCVHEMNKLDDAFRAKYSKGGLPVDQVVYGQLLYTLTITTLTGSFRVDGLREIQVMLQQDSTRKSLPLFKVLGLARTHNKLGLPEAYLTKVVGNAEAIDEAYRARRRQGDEKVARDIVKSDLLRDKDVRRYSSALSRKTRRAALNVSSSRYSVASGLIDKNSTVDVRTQLEDLYGQLQKLYKVLVPHIEKRRTQRFHLPAREYYASLESLARTHSEACKLWDSALLLHGRKDWEEAVMGDLRGRPQFLILPGYRQQSNSWNPSSIALAFVAAEHKGTPEDAEPIIWLSPIYNQLKRLPGQKRKPDHYFALRVAMVYGATSADTEENRESAVAYILMHLQNAGFVRRVPPEAGGSQAYQTVISYTKLKEALVQQRGYFSHLLYHIEGLNGRDRVNFFTALKSVIKDFHTVHSYKTAADVYQVDPRTNPMFSSAVRGVFQKVLRGRCECRPSEYQGRDFQRLVVDGFFT